MKKILLIMICFSFIFISCNKKKENITELKTSKKVEVKESGPEIPESYEHHQKIFFEYDELPLSVYKSPDSSEVIHNIQKGDEIETSRILEYKKSGKIFLECRLNSNDTGYIRLSINPYKNGQFSVIGNTDGNLRILNFDSQMNIKKDSRILKLPDENSEVIFIVSENQLFDVTAITENWKWVKIRSSEFEGWTSVYNRYNNFDLGSDDIGTPDEMVVYDLIEKNVH